MNKFIALAVLLFAILPLKAQVFDPSMAGGGQFENPVTWEASFEKENDSSRVKNARSISLVRASMVVTTYFMLIIMALLPLWV